MTLSRCTLVTLTLCLALAAPAAVSADRAAAPDASAPEAGASACPTTIWLGGRRHAYFQRGRVNCTRARRAVRRLYATYGREGRPRGFRCRSTNRFRRSGGCSNSTNTRYFNFYRPR